MSGSYVGRALVGEGRFDAGDVVSGNNGVVFGDSGLVDHRVIGDENGAAEFFWKGDTD